MSMSATKPIAAKKPANIVEMNWDPITRIVGSLGIYTKIDFKQKKVAEEIQLDVWQEAPYYPLGQWLQPIAHRTTIEGIVKSPFPLFWNVKRSA